MYFWRNVKTKKLKNQIKIKSNQIKSNQIKSKSSQNQINDDETKEKCDLIIQIKILAMSSSSSSSSSSVNMIFRTNIYQFESATKLYQESLND